MVQPCLIYVTVKYQEETSQRRERFGFSTFDDKVHDKNLL